MEPIATPVIVAAAAASLNTYYVAGRNNRLFRLSGSTGTWLGVRDKCEDLGGRLTYPPDSSSARVLHHVFQNNYLAVGLRWQGQAWVDAEDQVVTSHPDWAPGEPNNGSGFDNYAMCILGLLMDYPNIDGLQGLCEV